MQVESVVRLREREDVWCLTVPDGAAFCLENGAVVHNCDALRYVAEAIRCGMVKFAYGPGLDPANVRPFEHRGSLYDPVKRRAKPMRVGG